MTGGNCLLVLEQELCLSTQSVNITIDSIWYCMTWAMIISTCSPNMNMYSSQSTGLTVLMYPSQSTGLTVL